MVNRGVEIGIHLAPGLADEASVALALGNLAAFRLASERKEKLQWQVLRVTGGDTHHFRLVVRHPDRMMDIGLRKKLEEYMMDMSSLSESKLKEAFDSAEESINRLLVYRLHMIPLMKPIIDEDMVEAAKHALENERLVDGESVNKFEEEFARYIGKKYAIAVNSGTSALTLGLLSLNLRKDDLVIAPSATFVATANAIAHAGATPLLLDIDMYDYTISVKAIREAIRIYGKRIKAIIPVHLYGRPSKMNDLINICNDSGITLFEDSCQAHGGEYLGKKLGSFGDLSAFSFYSSKNITVGGDGGMLLTDDDEIADYVRSMRNQGAFRGNRYVNNIIGYNFRLNNVNCAIGRVQLKKLNSWIMHRRKIAERYAALLKDKNQVILPPMDDQIAKSAWHIFAVRIKDRDKVSKFLLEHGVETGIHYPIPVHLQKAYQNGNAVVPFQMTSTEEWSNETLSLPMYSDMDLENVDLVVSYLSKYAWR